jgi:hypothetical protein
VSPGEAVNEAVKSIPPACRAQERRLGSDRQPSAHDCILGRPKRAPDCRRLATATQFGRDPFRCASVPTAGRGSTEPIGVAGRR